MLKSSVTTLLLGIIVCLLLAIIGLLMEDCQHTEHFNAILQKEVCEVPWVPPPLIIFLIFCNNPTDYVSSWQLNPLAEAVVELGDRKPFSVEYISQVSVPQIRQYLDGVVNIEGWGPVQSCAGSLIWIPVEGNPQQTLR
jgi:hypothetical protein